MLSTPPAIMMSASPERIAREVLICRIIVDRKGYALFRLDQGDGRVALVREIAEAKGWS